MAAAAVIRRARPQDIPAIAAIYAVYVRETAITFDVEVPSHADWRRRWDAAQAAGHPWLVTEDAGAVAGYATASTFRPKAAYRSTVETSIYLAAGAVGRGLGRPLYAAALEEMAAAGFHLAVAGTTLPNPASIALHERVGFVAVGVFEQIGHKLGGWRDVQWWQRRLDGATRS